jgi:DNA-binding response OmpR family regulator
MKEMEILVIDDDSDDVQFLQQALNDSDFDCTLIAFFDPDAAFTHLQRKAERGEKLPNLIITDLNMPRVEGLQVISFLKAHATLNRIPVVVLSVSKRGEDSEKSFMLGAAGYFVKPRREAEWDPIIQAIKDIVLQDKEVDKT